MKRLLSASVLVIIGILLLVVDRPVFTIYGQLLAAVLGARIALSLIHRPARNTTRQEKGISYKYVTVVLPFYNEDVALLEAALRAIGAQSRLPQRLHIVNDGSPQGDAQVRRLLPFLRGSMDVEYTVFASNRGKRAALVEAFKHERTDIFITTDSDTVLDERAIEEGLKPFRDSRVTAVTGQVGALNRDRNLLTRLTDMRYANSFLHERAAFSVLGSVLVCCGALALYRADVVRRYTHAFLGQRFLGRPSRIGDDRRLTNYALLHGRVVFQDTALAYTRVPERASHYIRQQIRWTRSFIQESLWIIQTFPLSHRIFWICVIDVSLWLIFSTLVIWYFMVNPLALGRIVVPAYFVFALLLGHARSTRYLEIRREGLSAAEQMLLFLAAPLYGLAHAIAFVPLRLYSLATMRSMRWETRDREDSTTDVISDAGHHSR